MKTPLHPDFRPIPKALCDRARAYWKQVAAARTPAAATAALFLAHCEARDALAMLPGAEGETTKEEEV